MMNIADAKSQAATISDAITPIVLKALLPGNPPNIKSGIINVLVPKKNDTKNIVPLNTPPEMIAFVNATKNGGQ